MITWKLRSETGTADDRVSICALKGKRTHAGHAVASSASSCLPGYTPQGGLLTAHGLTHMRIHRPQGARRAAALRDLGASGQH